MPKLFMLRNTVLLSISILLIAMIYGAVITKNREVKQEAGPSLDGATNWRNTQPLTLARLHGKVVLVDFWTYTCINWRRTLPYIREWAAKYKDQGLVVIGVHTPEFSFEHNSENVSKAINQIGIDFPVTMDNNYDIWNSFKNHYWPALYLIDAQGKIRYEKFGEDNYAKIELQIQKLLKESSSVNIDTNLVAIQPKRYEVAADWENLHSPENFLGYDRTEGFASPEKIRFNKQVLYSEQGELKLNQWRLAGAWTIGSENAGLNEGQGKIIYRFHARDLHLIMGTAVPGTAVKFRVLLYGRPPGQAHGIDVDSNGYGTVTEPRMYQLIRQQGAVIDREFEIEFLAPGVQVYDFTFG